MSPRTHFMQQKFPVKVAFDHFYRDVARLDSGTLSSGEQLKLNQYLDAIKTIRECSAFDIARAAVSFRNQLSGKFRDIWYALFIIIGDEIKSISDIDITYLKIMHSYAKGLYKYRGNVKEIVLRSLIAGRYSPIAPYFEKKLYQLIINTQNKIKASQN